MTDRIFEHTRNLEDAVKILITECIINPSDSQRKIENFDFVMSNDSSIKSINVKTECNRGSNLYETITSLCSQHNVGLKIYLENNRFKFTLYNGKNRSYDQTDNSYVVFTPKFDNLTDSNYAESDKELKNVVLIKGGEEVNEGGDGEDEEGCTYLTVGKAVGLERREMFADETSITKSVTEYNAETGEEEEINYLEDSEYIEVLQKKGEEKLSEKNTIKTFEGQIVNNILYQYGVDYFIGDVVQIEDAYGHSEKTRVIELVHSQDLEGFKIYPTFKTDEKEENN